MHGDTETGLWFLPDEIHRRQKRSDGVLSQCHGIQPEEGGVEGDMRSTMPKDLKEGPKRSIMRLSRQMSVAFPHKE